MSPSSNGKLTITPSEAIDRERAALPLPPFGPFPTRLSK